MPTVPTVPKKAKLTCLNVYRLVALTSVAMKCFERLVKAHINTIITDTLDPLQFTYCPNRSAVDAISTALHFVLSHLEKRNTYMYVIIMFTDYSSVFYAIVPSKLITKPRTLGLPTGSGTDTPSLESTGP